MSETSSDAESSCGWTIISNEGSDIETLGSEAALEYGVELLERPPVEETALQDTLASASDAGCIEERGADSLGETLVEQTVEETLCTFEDRDNAAGKEHMTLLSSSDHSDIVTLRDLKEDEHADVERGEEEEEEEEEAAAAAAKEKIYLGTSCSSQYAFTAAETVFQVQQPAGKTSSSSEDEARQSPSTVTRRRRVRKNTTCIVTEPGEQEDQGEVEEEEEQAEIRLAPDTGMQGRGSSILNKFVLLALVIVISMGFGHFFGRVQIQERRKTVEKIRVNELDGVMDRFQQNIQPLTTQRGDSGLKELDAQQVISLLTDVIEKLKKENQETNLKQAHIQAKRDDMEMLLKQSADERIGVMAQQQGLTAENLQLKRSLERKENSLSTSQQELRNLRSMIRDLETMTTGADLLVSENKRLKEQLEEEKRLIGHVHAQKEEFLAEAQTLREKLDKERKVTDELRRELSRMRRDAHGAGNEAGSEGQELQSRLMELEKKLTFEQQRSNLWERLYVETKEERAKGDKDSKVKKPMAGKVKETFDAVKNSTIEFIHHHKEQIKKSKEAVKENLRKFSDSVKHTFRHFKDSASAFINKARGFYNKKRDKKDTKESWQHRFHKPLHRQSHKYDDSFESNHNTRKSGHKVHEDRGQSGPKADQKGCSGILDCAHRESMSFNKALQPIRADEFHQVMQSYLQQEFDHLHHGKELETFINSYFHDGVFIHDQMLFTDFVRGVENYLAHMREYQGLNDDMFGDLEDYVYRHFFGKTSANSKEGSRPKHRQGKQHRATSRSERK